MLVVVRCKKRGILGRSRGCGSEFIARCPAAATAAGGTGVLGVVVGALRYEDDIGKAEVAGQRDSCGG